MSVLTESALAQARASLTQASRAARREEERCLGALAHALPQQLAEVAEADIELERDAAADRAGVRSRAAAARIRTELADATAAFAATVEAGADDVPWPRREHGFDSVSTLDVAPAVYCFLATRLAPLTSVVARHARRGRDDRAVRRVLAPRPFFDPFSFGAVAAALERMTAAEARVEAAEREHELSTLNACWDSRG